MGAAGGGRATGREHSLATPSAPPGSPRAHQLPPPPFLQELELLQDGDGVFKLMGPALVKQDREEAVATVRKRLDYIAAEVARLQAAVKEAEAKGEVLQAKARACGAVRVRGWGFEHTRFTRLGVAASSSLGGSFAWRGCGPLLGCVCVSSKV